MIGMLACGEKETDTSTVEDTGTQEDTGETEQEALEFVGSWEDNYGSFLEVSESEISSSYGSSYTIDSYNNEEMWVVAQNDSTNAYNPDLWSKFEWHQEDGALYYCQSAYDAADAQTAQDTMADRSDLVSGCGGFGWSILRTQVSITDTYTDNWGGSHVVNAFTWTSGDYGFAIETTNE